MSNTYKGKEYKLEAGQYDCFEGWKNDNVDYIVEHFGNDILLIQNENGRNYGNVFDDSQIETKTSEWMTIYGIELRVDNLTDNEYQVNDYDDEDKNRSRIEEWIRKHTIEIEARGYSQGDYDCYYILVNDLKKKEEITKQLDFIKEIFTITSTEVRLFERKTLEENETEYFTEWEEIDSEESQEEFVDVGELSQILLKRNDVESYFDIENIPTEAHYIG